MRLFGLPRFAAVRVSPASRFRSSIRPARTCRVQVKVAMCFHLQPAAVGGRLLNRLRLGNTRHPRRTVPGASEPRVSFRSRALAPAPGRRCQLGDRLLHGASFSGRSFGDITTAGGRRGSAFPVPPGRPHETWEKQGVPLLYGYSPSVIPKPKQWSNLHVVCGYWFLDKPRDWSPPKALLEFWPQGRHRITSASAAWLWPVGSD